MKEFDKIYIAKYQHFLNTKQLALDLNTSQKNIILTQNELKENGLDIIYEKIPDEEWEKLEHIDDNKIKLKYYKKSKILNKKLFEKLVEICKVNIFETIREFPKYEYSEKDFTREYMKEEDYEGEEWKAIEKLNYQVSNYGRIRNVTSKKLKQLKFQAYGMQVVLWHNSIGHTITISRLVAEMFIRHLEKDERVRHINGNIRDNYFKNLEIVKK